MVLLFGFVVFGYNLHAKNIFGIRHGHSPYSTPPHAPPLRTAGCDATDSSLCVTSLAVGGLVLYSRIKLAESAAQSYTRVPMTEPVGEKSSAAGANGTA